MSNFCFYMKLEPYLAQWLVNRLGNPVRFPAQSNENAIIRRFVQRPPDGTAPDLPGDGLIAVAIPDSKAKDPQYYHYMGVKAKRALAEAINDLFTMCLWNDVRDLLDEGQNGVNTIIEAWCEMHGVTADSEAVRQRYYRLRRKYASQGVNLLNFEKKNTPQGV
jgi:hypothetical protein